MPEALLVAVARVGEDDAPVRVLVRRLAYSIGGGTCVHRSSGWVFARTRSSCGSKRHLEN